MKTDYVADKEARKSSAMKAVWVLVIISIIFIFALFKFGHSGIHLGNSGMPTDDDAFEVAKDFVKITVRSNKVDFPGSGYQIAKREDSVYVIRSVVELTDDAGEKKTNNFKVLMQYKGGRPDDQKNWNLLNISQEQ
jgi:hypothetical protein